MTTQKTEIKNRYTGEVIKTVDGAKGKFLDKQLGTSTAATLLLWQPGKEMPSFAPDATDDETLGRLRAMVAK